MSGPFYIVPWDKPFFPALRRMILETTGGRPHKALVVFPHDRPRRYLSDEFARSGHRGFLPRSLTVQELFGLIRGGDSLREAGLLDRIALLHACCLEISQGPDSLGERLARGGLEGFFPWGERLAALVEECLIQGITPEDMHHTDTEVEPFGADLLAALGRIFAAYVRALPDQGRTTPGFDAHRALGRIAREGLPPLLRDNTVLLAGFHRLTGTEERLFKRLWQNGARILFHTDPALANAEAEAHWSCREHARWLEAWQAEAVLVEPPAGTKPGLIFFSGHDIHSQLAQLAQDIAQDMADNPDADRAVALTHPELLLPVLHHLPDKNCNISLGYPLERSNLHSLLDCILSLAEGRTPEGRLPWRPFAALACHPWLRLLQPEAAPDYEADFPLLLHMLDSRIRQSTRFQDPELQATEALDDFASAKGYGRGQGPNVPEAALLQEVIRCAVLAWGEARTLQDTAECLAGLATLLGSRGSIVWQRFPLDGECLARLVRNVIGPLRDTILARAPLPVSLRHGMVRMLLRAERVPFEADPITGLQVLGMLETRLLRFSRVFLVDATDNVLPGTTSHDPLLPDSLRAAIGLPDSRQREQLAAHTFHRLLAGAGQVFIYWQEGSQASGLLDAVTQRSRLVEELIWQEEQRLGTLLKPGTPPLRMSAPVLRPPRRSRKTLQRTPAMQAKMDAILAGPVSPARLDAYLNCPLAFYYQYLAGLTSRAEVAEGDEPAAVGDLLHTVLREAYSPFIGRSVRRGDLSAGQLERIFQKHLKSSGLTAALPPESAAMLTLAGPERLRRYLDAQPDETHILCLEKDVSVACDLPGGRITLRGRIDRVDSREGQALILDYKSGSVRRPDPDFWSNHEFWQAMETLLDASGPGLNRRNRASDMSEADALLAELAVLCPSLQLGCYLLMCSRSGLLPEGVVPGNAAWVELRDKGDEIAFLDVNMTPQEQATVLERHIPAALGFLVRHMRSARAFIPRDGVHCGWCSFRNLCMLAE